MRVVALFTMAKNKDKENIVHVPSEILFSHKEKLNNDFCRKNDGIRNYLKLNYTRMERQKSHFSLISR